MLEEVTKDVPQQTVRAPCVERLAELSADIVDAYLCQDHERGQ